MDTEKKPIENKELSCGVVPVRFAWGDWQLLVLRRGESWSFPAGIISVHAFGEDYKETVPYAGNKVDRFYVAETRIENLTLPIARKLGKPAHDEWRWVTCDEAEDYLPPRLTHVLEWVRTRVND